jgi:hypothetical protein
MVWISGAGFKTFKWTVRVSGVISGAVRRIWTAFHAARDILLY